MADVLAGRRRIVVKIGSSLLVDPKLGLKADWLSSLADDLATLAREGAQILLVSSGAIALGRTVLGLPRRNLKLDEAQAAASVGQDRAGTGVVGGAGRARSRRWTCC